MLVALTKENQYFSLVGRRYQKQTLLQIRKTEQFYCPACKSEVILKIGDKHAWHFAHKHNSSCIDYMEGETAYHIKGKSLLYEWLSKQGYDVYLERYLPDIKQRADLLVKIGNKSYVIEFQCSKIPPQLYIKRTRAYLDYQYTPIWILGGNLLKRLQVNLFQLSSFHWLFVYQKQITYFPKLISFCPETEKFLVLNNLLALSQNRSACTPSFFPLSSASLDTLFQTNDSIPISTWLHTKKQNWRRQRLRLSQSEKFLRNIYYNKGKPFWLFPSEAGFPVCGHHYIETPTYIWQSWLLEMFVLNKNIGQTIHINMIYRAFKTLVKKRVFNLRALPLMEQGGEYDAIRNYLLFLCAIELLQTKESVLFTINKRINPSLSMKEVLKKDYDLASKLFKNNSIFKK